MLSNSGIFGSYRTIGIKENTGCIFVHLVQVAGLDKIKSQQCASMMQFLSVGMKIKLSIGTKPNIFCNDVKDAELGVHQQHGQVLVLSRGFQLQDCAMGVSCMCKTCVNFTRYTECVGYVMTVTNGVVSCVRVGCCLLLVGINWIYAVWPFH